MDKSWCRHFACTKDLLDRFQSAGAREDSAAIQDALWELQAELLGQKGVVLQHSLQGTWDAIHRLLTGDRGAETYLFLDRGEYPLRLAICGGEELNTDRQSEDLIAFVGNEQIPDLCRALEVIEEQWARKELMAMVDDATSSRVWADFCSLREFYQEAEMTRLPVVVVVEI